MEIEPKSQEGDLKNKLLSLMAYRVAIVTLIMGATAVIHLKEGGRFLTPSLIPIYILVGISYFITFLSLVTLRLVLVKKVDWFANLQVATDIVIATALVYVTGGIESILSFLYIFIIIGAGIVLYGKGVFLTASLSSILYGSLLDLQYYEYIPALESPLSQPQSYTEMQLFYRVLGNIAAFYTVALLSGYLFKQLRKTGERLKEREIDYDKLEALNRKIVQEINTGLMTIDGGGLITSFNRAAEDITGYRLIDVYETKIDDIFPGMMDKLIEYKGDINFRRGTWRWETPYRNRRGDLLHLGFSISSLRGREGKEIGYIIIFQNLTYYKEMEEAVKRAERLATMGKVAAGIAHEIRNPLASMSSSIQILHDELELDEENRRLMEIILKEMERVNGLIGNFLDYAKPYKPKKEEVDFSKVMAETLGVFEKGLSQNQKIKIQKEITPDIKIFGEEERLKEVFWNLLNNAVQSMPEGGEIAASLKNDGDRAIAVIKDSGVGIEEKDMRKVFEPFFTTKTYGTGLGLATVYRIVEAHGGEIRVESKKERGTTFTLIFPIEFRAGRL